MIKRKEFGTINVAKVVHRYGVKHVANDIILQVTQSVFAMRLLELSQLCLYQLLSTSPSDHRLLSTNKSTRIQITTNLFLLDEP